jgi:hypothetical protein
MFEDDELGAGNKLQNNFTLFFHFPQDSDWTMNSYKEVSTFSSVEKMVELFKHLPPIIVEKGMVFIMKEDIQPMWEDPINMQGGCFCYKVPKAESFKSFQMLAFAFCGKIALSENSDFVDTVTGITISPKQGEFNIIKIWTSGLIFQDPTVVNKFYNTFSSKGCIFKKHN